MPPSFFPISTSCVCFWKCSNYEGFSVVQVCGENDNNMRKEIFKKVKEKKEDQHSPWATCVQRTWDKCPVTKLTGKQQKEINWKQRKSSAVYFPFRIPPLFFLPSLAEWEVTLSPIKKQKKCGEIETTQFRCPVLLIPSPSTCKIPTPHGTDPLLTSYPLLPFSFVFISLADDDLASTCPFALSRLSIRCGSRWQTVVTKRREEKTGSAAFICLFRLWYSLMFRTAFFFPPLIFASIFPLCIVEEIHSGLGVVSLAVSGFQTVPSIWQCVYYGNQVTRRISRHSQQVVGFIQFCTTMSSTTTGKSSHQLRAVQQHYLWWESAGTDYSLFKKKHHLSFLFFFSNNING